MKKKNAPKANPIKNNQEIKAIKKELLLLQEKLNRSLADYDNLEKRTRQRQQSIFEEASASLIDKLLPVLDDLFRAQSALSNSGLNLAVEQFLSVLQAEGLEEIKAKGQDFDPLTMDCVDLTKGQSNKVLKVLEKGYFFKGSVLRPAKVIVGAANPSANNILKKE